MNSTQDPSSHSRQGGTAHIAPFEAEWKTLTASFSTHTNCREAAKALAFQYEYMAFASPVANPNDQMRIEVNRVPGLVESSSPIDSPSDLAYEISIDRDLVATVNGTGQLLHELDNQLARELQLRMPRFYFVHSATLAKGHSATMIAGNSGAGKSTMSLALCAAGLRYLSDELSPVDLETLAVQPYPRAICLKNEPPAPLSLPPGTLKTEWTFHVRAEDAGAKVSNEAARLDRIVFLNQEASHEGPALRELSPGEAAMRLYQNALNQLAHESWGLDDTIRLVSRAACFELRRAGIDENLRAFEELGAL